MTRIPVRLLIAIVGVVALLAAATVLLIANRSSKAPRETVDTRAPGSDAAAVPDVGHVEAIVSVEGGLTRAQILTALMDHVSEYGAVADERTRVVVGFSVGLDGRVTPDALTDTSTTSVLELTSERSAKAGSREELAEGVSQITRLQVQYPRPVGEPAKVEVTWLIGFHQDGARVIQDATPPPEVASLELGKKVYKSSCKSCHTLDGRPLNGPSFRGIWGTQQTLSDDTKVIVDENFVRTSLAAPSRQRIKGYPDMMPSFSYLSNARVDSIILFLKDQK